MFKSLKRNSDKVKEKLDFKLGFHATQVPLQGWEKLVISVIPYETGRPVAKTPRAVVKNGECHWPDSIIETTKMVFDTRTNSYEEKKYRFIVSSGSSRSGVLGEVTINFGDFAASKHPQQKGLALRNCTTGTLLHVTVTCLTPKSHDSVKDSDKPSEKPTKTGNDADEVESVASDSDDIDKLNLATSNGQLDSPRKPPLDSPPLSPSSGARKLQQRNISTSSLRYSSSSFDSLEVPSPLGATSFTDNMHGYPGENLSSSSSFASLPEKPDRSRETVGVDSKPSSPLANLGHNRTLSSSVTSVGHQQVRQTERTLNQGEVRVVSGPPIEVLHRSPLKLSAEVEDLNRKLEKNMQANKEKEMEVSVLTAERDGLKQEVDNLKSTKHASQDPEGGTDESRRAVEDAQRVIQELKEEIVSEKNTISSLNEQLQKTQQHNLKLVSEIDELLDTANNNDSLAQAESDWTTKLATKDDEIKGLQARIMDLEEKNSQIQTSAPPETSDTLVNGLQNMVKQLQQDVEELEADTTRLTDENSDLHSKLESSSLELSEKSKLIDDLKASGTTSQPRAPDNLMKQLQQDVEELEAETNRLTDENAELRASLESSSSELSEKNKLLAEMKASSSVPQPRAPDNLLKQLQQDVEELEAETNRLTDENTELRVSLESSSSELGEKNKLIAEMKITESAEEDRAQLLGKVLSLERELNQLKEKTTQTHSEKEEAEKSVQLLQTENQELQKYIKILESSQPESVGRVQEREVANNQLFQQLAETVRGLEEELQESQEESRLSRLHVGELKNEILALASSGHNQSSTELESLRKLLESEKLDKENIQRSAEERARVNQEHLDHVLDESELLKDKIEELQKEVQNAEARAVELEEENFPISNRVSGLELQLKYMTEERDKQQQEAGEVEEEKSYLLNERERLQSALDSTSQKHQDLVRHLTAELNEANKACEEFKNTQPHLEQEVMRLQGELQEAQYDLQEHTKTFESSRAMLEESFQTISSDHANAVAVSKTFEAQVAQLQSDLEDMEMRTATEVKTLSMLKESEQHRAEKAEQALQQSELLQRENSILQKRVAELELLLEDERASYSADNNGSSNGHSNGHDSHEGGRLKALELEKVKQEFVEKESSLLSEIERLELANEQLIQGATDSDLQQLQVELTRLQNQKAALNRHIKELESQLNTRDMFQSEAERLQEVNEKLDNRLQKYKAAAAGSNMVEKVAHLETELAEAIEANNMYKVQLRSAFAEPQNVHAVALQNFGDVDTVVSDLMELRRRVKQLESELRDMRDRYSTMSLRFAEVEGEREELVMTIRTLRNTRGRVGV